MDPQTLALLQLLNSGADPSETILSANQQGQQPQPVPGQQQQQRMQALQGQPSQGPANPYMAALQALMSSGQQPQPLPQGAINA